MCACFHCMSAFPPEIITRWTDRQAIGAQGQTAHCPECDIDSVIGSESGYPIWDRPFLQAMHDHWFSEAKAPA